MNVTTKNYAIGARVVRGPSWQFIWEDQDKGALCGIIKRPATTQNWMIVSWINRIGKMLREYGYPIDTPSLQFYNKAPLYERGMKIKVCHEGECQGDGFLYKPTGKTEKIIGVANKEGEILDIIWFNNKYYYNLSCYEKNVSYIAEDALIPLDEKPQPKFKVGEILYVKDPKHQHPQCVVSKRDLEDGKPDFNTSSLPSGHSLGKVKQVIYCEQNSSYYYLCDRYYPNCYLEDAIKLANEPKSLVKEKQTTIIHNQKSNQNGTEQITTAKTTTGKTIEVCDSIGTIPVGKRSTGTVIQGRGSNPSVVSRLVSYKAITC